MGIFNKNKKQVEDDVAIVKEPLNLESLGIKEYKDEIEYLFYIMEILEAWHMTIFGLLYQVGSFVRTIDGKDSAPIPLFSFFLNFNEANVNSEWSHKLPYVFRSIDIVDEIPQMDDEVIKGKYLKINSVFEELYRERDDHQYELNFDPLCGKRYLRFLIFSFAFPELFPKECVDYNKITLGFLGFIISNTEYIGLDRSN